MSAQTHQVRFSGGVFRAFGRGLDRMSFPAVTDGGGEPEEDVFGPLLDAEAAVEEHVVSRRDSYGRSVSYLQSLARREEPDPGDRAAFEGYASDTLD